MKYDFDTVVDRMGTDCVKYDLGQVMNGRDDLLPMWVADMDFPAPPEVTEAIKDRADHGIFGYSFMGESYKKAVKNWFETRHDFRINPDHIVTTPGIVYGIATAVMALTEPRDKILINRPVYYPFTNMVEKNDRVIVNSPLKYEDNKYTIDFADFEQKIQENQVKLFILCNPHNPVGRVWTIEELQTIGSICKKYDVKVFADEIHCDFTYPGYTYTPFLKACPDMADSVIMATAPSKTFNLAGLQCSNLIIPGQELRTAFHGVMEKQAIENPNVLGMVACQAAYEQGGDWLDQLQDYLTGNLSFIRNFLVAYLPQVKLVEPEGTYLIWLDFSKIFSDKETLDYAIKDISHLWLDAGEMFGPEGDLFQRVNIAAPRKTIEEFCRRLQRVI